MTERYAYNEPVTKAVCCTVEKWEKLSVKSGVDVVVLYRRNHNLFQPLLYQVATAALSPADIAEPIRRTLSRFKNIRVLLADVEAVDPVARAIHTAGGAVIGYDLFLPSGSKYNYFGHDEWRDLAPGLKTLRARTQDEKQAWLTTVVIAGGPTGVEMAGAIHELGRFMIERDFRDLKQEQMHVINLSIYAEEYLSPVGITVRTGAVVTDIREDKVRFGEEVGRCGCLIWGAGIKASPAASWLTMTGDRTCGIPVSATAVIEDVTKYTRSVTRRWCSTTLASPSPRLPRSLSSRGYTLGGGCGTC